MKYEKGHKSYAFKDETGNRYGNLIVIKRVENTKYQTVRWLCKCDCGNEVIRQAYSLRMKGSGRHSCGCDMGRRRSGETPIKRHFFTYRNHAKERNLPFKLTFEQFKKLVFENCYYCKSAPYIRKFAYYRTRYSQGSQTDMGLVFNGIDKLIPNKGYILENCVSCCVYCNRAKSDLSVEEFRKQVIRLYKGFILCEN